MGQIDTGLAMEGRTDGHRGLGMEGGTDGPRTRDG